VGVNFVCVCCGIFMYFTVRVRGLVPGRNLGRPQISHIELIGRPQFLAAAPFLFVARVGTINFNSSASLTPHSLVDIKQLRSSEYAFVQN